MIKAVLFDYGGVLSLGGKNFRGFLRDLLNVEALQERTETLIADLGRGKISSQEFVDHLNSDYDKEIDVEAVVGTHSFPKSEDVYALAASIKQQGIMVGILSNTSDLNAYRLREEGFYKGFDPVVLSCTENFAKPDVEIYQIAIERTGFKPEEILFIDDQERFLVPARELGLHTIRADAEQQIVVDTKALLKEQNGLEL